MSWAPHILENPYGICSACGKFLSSEDVYKLCWRCFADNKEPKRQIVFDKPAPDGEYNRQQLEEKAQRLKSIFEEATA
jgi:predicted amidophosphoribosyltransferase